MTETCEELAARLAEYETLLANSKEKRQQAIADGNREIAGKIHQIEKEFTKRVVELRECLADQSQP